MSVWERARMEERCGNCSDRIPAGEPMLVFRGRPPAKWKSVRCGQFACAREPIPENLPAVAELPVVLGPRPMLKVGPDMLPLDYKTRAGGE